MEFICYDREIINYIIVTLIFHYVHSSAMKLLPKKYGQSAVWDYYGFRPSNVKGMEGEPLDKNMPTCRVCLKDVKRAG